MEIKVKWPILLCVLLIPLLILPLAFFNYKKGAISEVDVSLLRKLTELEEANSTLKTKKQSLEKVISEVGDKNESLLAQIATLRSKKQQIKYVDVIKYKTEEVVVVKEILPPSYLYLTKEGMPICSFEYNENYIFRVIPIEYELDIVKSDKTTLVTLKGKPESEDKYYELPININESISKKITKYPKIDPNISIGLAARYSNKLSIAPTIQTPFLHLKESIDILTPKVTLSNDISIGLDIANYKISDHLPLVTDTWLGIGPSFSLEQKHLEITLTSKF